MRIDTNSPAVSNTTRAALFWGTYESAERRLLRRHPPSSGLVIDLGASLGVVSATAARHLPAGSTMTCVEANPDLLGLLAANVAANAPNVQVTTIHGAIDYGSEPDAQVWFHTSGQHIASALSSNSTGSGFSAPVVRLRNLVPAEGWFDLMCDIEGAEVGLLLEESDVLARCANLYIEAHATTHRGQHFGVQEIHALIEQLSFERVALYGHSSVWSRLDQMGAR